MVIEWYFFFWYQYFKNDNATYSSTAHAFCKVSKPGSNLARTEQVIWLHR